jgi:hypothetical protein
MQQLERYGLVLVERRPKSLSGSVFLAMWVTGSGIEGLLVCSNAKLRRMRRNLNEPVRGRRIWLSRFTEATAPYFLTAHRPPFCPTRSIPSGCSLDGRDLTKSRRSGAWSEARSHGLSCKDLMATWKLIEELSLHLFEFSSSRNLFTETCFRQTTSMPA